MKILRVAQKVYPGVKGGGPYHVHALSRDQADRGHEVTILTIRNDPELPHKEKKEGYKIIRFDPLFSVFGNDISPGLVKYLTQAQDFDIVHAHSHLYFATNMAAIKKQFGDFPLAVTNHGLYSQSAPKKLQKLYLRSFGKWTFNRADLIFCYTKGVEQRFRAHGIKPPIEIISNGIDHKRFKPTGMKSKPVDADGRTILCVIRLVDGKRPKDAINAMLKLQNTFPDSHLYIAGDGYLRDELHGFIKNRSLEDTVTLLGNIPYDEMPKLYRSCDVLLLPSEEEAGAPRVILEAMATKKPFIITNMKQTTELLTDLGLTVPVGDPDAIADALVKLLSNPDLCEEMGKEGRELVEKEFNWEKTVDQTTEYLEKCIQDYHAP